MKYKIGDTVKYIGEREKIVLGQVGIITHRKDSPKAEQNIIRSISEYPKPGFDYTVRFDKYGPIDLVVNAHENELRIV